MFLGVCWNQPVCVSVYKILQRNPLISNDHLSDEKLLLSDHCYYPHFHFRHMDSKNSALNRKKSCSGKLTYFTTLFTLFTHATHGICTCTYYALGLFYGLFCPLKSNVSFLSTFFTNPFEKNIRSGQLGKNLRVFYWIF